MTTRRLPRPRAPGRGGDAPRPVVSRGSLDRAAGEAHREWLLRGRTGTGRLDVAGLTATNRRFDGFKAVAARFEDVDFHDSNFDLSDWSEVELVRCNLNASRINSTRFDSARIRSCTFEGCGGATASFDGATIHGSSFARSGLDGTRFVGATVDATSFDGVRFDNARFDRATFQGCSFRGASLEPHRKLPPSTLRGARFERCDFTDADFTGTDLRGATFDRCVLAGTRGAPRRSESLSVVGCDLEAEAWLARLRPTLSATDVLARPDLVVAEDRAAGDAVLAVFELVGKRARAFGRIAARDIDGLREAAIRFGATCGPSDFVWAHDGETFRVWNSEGMPLEVTRKELRMSGVPSPVADMKSVAVLHDPERRGRRGVIVRTPAARPTRLVVVQEDDWLVSDDRAYAEEAARREGEWARQLARDLATWLGVPYEDREGEPTV